MKEKEKEIDDLKSELKDLKQQTGNLNDENKDLKNTLQKKSVELDEAAKLLKRDENIISWLNKQITDNNISSKGNYDTSSSSQGVVFKPYGALLPSSNGGLSTGLSNGGQGSQNQHLLDSGLNMMRLNAGGSQSNQYLNKSNERLYMGSSNQQQQQQMYPSSNYQHRTAALSSSSSSSIQQCSDALKENQETYEKNLVYFKSYIEPERNLQWNVLFDA